MRNPLQEQQSQELTQQLTQQPLSQEEQTAYLEQKIDDLQQDIIFRRNYQKILCVAMAFGVVIASLPTLIDEKDNPDLKSLQQNVGAWVTIASSVCCIINESVRACSRYWIDNYRRDIEILNAPPILQKLSTMSNQPIQSQPETVDEFKEKINLMLADIEKLATEGKTTQEIIDSTHIYCAILFKNPSYDELRKILAYGNVNQHQYLQTLSPEELQKYKSHISLIKYVFRVELDLKENRSIPILQQLYTKSDEPIQSSQARLDNFLASINHVLANTKDYAKEGKTTQEILDAIYIYKNCGTLSSHIPFNELVKKLIEANVHQHQYSQTLTPEELQEYTSFISIVKHHLRKNWFMTHSEDLPILQELSPAYIEQIQSSQKTADEFVDKVNHILYNIKKLRQDGKTIKEIQNDIHKDCSELSTHTSYNSLVFTLLDENNANEHLHFISTLKPEELKQYKEYMSLIKTILKQQCNLPKHEPTTPYYRLLTISPSSSSSSDSMQQSPPTRMNPQVAVNTAGSIEMGAIGAMGA